MEPGLSRVQGWSIKHGHRKRFDQTVKRSPHNGSRRHFQEYWSDYQIHTRCILRQHLVTSLVDFEEMAVSMEWHDEDADEDCFSEISFCTCESESTTASSRDRLWLCLLGGHCKASKRWGEADGRTDMIAKPTSKT